MFIETGKGNIYYEVNGEGPGVLFLHGLGGSLDSMYPIGESLKSYKRIYVDIPCHGKSDNFEINFDDISTFLVDLKLTRKRLWNMRKVIPSKQRDFFISQMKL